MGGTLFNQNKDRMSKKEYILLTKEVLNLLGENIKRIKPLKQIGEKKTFGDIDFLISKQYFSNGLNVVNFIKETYNTEDVKTTANGVSFLYKGRQIDFILIDWRLVDCISVFYDWNDLGNLIGRLSKFYHCKFKPTGLYFDLFTSKKDKKLVEIFISNDVEKIFKFLNLDYNVYNSGFETYTDAFDFILKSNNFNYKFYIDREFVNGEAYRRDRIRVTYLNFLEYINRLDLTDKVVERGKVEDSLDYIDSMFPEIKIKEVIETEKIKYDESEKAKLVYNGRLIMDYTGLMGEELGLFKQYLYVNWINKLDKKIYEYSSDEIKNKIIEYFNIYKNEGGNEL